MDKSTLWVATLICYSAFSLTVQALPDGGSGGIEALPDGGSGGFQENRYGSCVCNQNCPSGDVLQQLKQLDEKVLSLSANGENKTESSVHLERKMGLQLENVLQQLKQLDEKVQSLSGNGESQTEVSVQLERKIDLQIGNVLTNVKQLDDKLQSLLANVASQAENIVQMERKIDSQLEKSPASLCPRDFTYSTESKMCIKLYLDKRTWAAAKDSCYDIGRGFRLAVPNTSKKLQFVENFSERNNVKSFLWLGGWQKDGEGRWLWLTGESFTHGWKSGQPDNHGGHENCLSLHSSRTGLNDYPCTRTVGYFCEYQLN